jgi:hypothetical protein
MRQGIRPLIFFGIAALANAGCENGPSLAGIDGGGVRSPVAAQGPIQGFGSIIVNDVHYELGSAEIRVNGAPATETDLAVGQHVTLLGNVDTSGIAVADSVTFEANIQGPVDSIDLTSSRLVVMGQAVSSNAATVFDLGSAPPALASISTGDLLRVSGFTGAGDLLQATRIERHTPQDDLRVIGSVDDLNQSNSRFEINDLVIDYGSVQLLQGFPGGQPIENDRVLVEAAGFSPSGALLADSITLLEPGLGGSAGQGAEVEGLITRFVSPTDFDVSGLPITTTTSTDYEGGGPNSLLLNVKIQVEGRLNAAGIIVASKIEVKDGGRVVGTS